MSILENLTRKVTDTAKAAAKKSGEIVEVTRLQINIAAEESKIEKGYVEIGKSVYNAYIRGEEISEVFKAQCDTIKSYEENIANMKVKVQELKNVKNCSSCFAELSLDVAFCPKCGTRQEISQPVVEEPVEKTCGACASTNALDSVFCVKCGNKLEE